MEQIAQAIERDASEKETNEFRQFIAQRLLFDRHEEIWADRMPSSVLSAADAARQSLEQAGVRVVAVEAIERYADIESKLRDAVVQSKPANSQSITDRLDAVLTHRLWGSVLFFALMLVMFQAVFSWSAPFMDLIETAVGTLGGWLGSLIPAGAINSLIVDGIIGGVGGVLVFLPQIFALFLFISVLEDCGYMSRAAYLMDKLMSRVGLSGKSFIPLLSSFACAIPGVMATRTIENPRDRLITMLIAPLMSCSARLPVYTLFIAAFIPQRQLLGPLVTMQGVTMFAMYFLGAAAAVGVAWILRKTLLRGETPSFVMELPPYKWPSLVNVLQRMLERGWAFVRRAGTLILAVSIVIWGLTYFPRSSAVEQRVRDGFADQITAVEQQLERTPADAVLESQLQNLHEECEMAVSAAHLRHSYLGSIGRVVEPAVRPLGWDWRIACGAIASFPAREVIVGTLGVIFSVGDEADEKTLSEQLTAARWEGTDRPLLTVPAALSVMVFFALCAQCMATLAVIRRETNSWRWPIFTFVYMTVLAYVGALLVYQVGTWCSS